MKKVRLFNVGFFIISIALLQSCAKEGCTDVDAVNYDSYVDKNDGSCTYEGSVVFWYDAETSDSLYYDGSTILIYTVDGEVVGTQNVNIYWTGAPDCNQDGSITVTKDLGSDKSKSFTYSVKDEFDYEIWGGNMQFDANTCWGHELVW